MSGGLVGGVYKKTPGQRPERHKLTRETSARSQLQKPGKIQLWSSLCCQFWLTFNSAVRIKVKLEQESAEKAWDQIDTVMFTSWMWSLNCRNITYYCRVKVIFTWDVLLLPLQEAKSVFTFFKAPENQIIFLFVLYIILSVSFTFLLFVRHFVNTVLKFYTSKIYLK